MLADLSPEEKLSCVLCRTQLARSDVRRGETLVREGFDWRTFRDFVNTHRLSGLIFQHISEHLTGAVPPAAFRQLQADAVVDGKRSEILVAELLQILGQLERAGIQALPYKGPVLAGRLWGDYRLRAYHDLDLLVQIEDREAAVGVFTKSGYGPVPSRPFHEVEQRLPGSPVRLCRNHELGFPILIDLQFRPVPAWIGRPAAVRNLWGQVRPATFQGQRISALSDEWNLVLLGLHVLVHRFAMLHWVTDFHTLAGQCDASWPAALERAAEIGARRELRFARKICDLILGDTEVGSRHARPKISALSDAGWRQGVAPENCGRRAHEHSQRHNLCAS